MLVDFQKIGEVTPKVKHVNIMFKIVGMEQVRNVRSKKDRTPHAVTEVEIADETGSALLTLWDEFLEKIEVGKFYKIENGYVSLFRGTIRVNIGKYGVFEEMDPLEIEINTENNISQKTFEDKRRSRPHEWFSSGSFWP